MQASLNSLSEKDKRYYVAVETHKLGRAGIAFNCPANDYRRFLKATTHPRDGAGGPPLAIPDA